MEVVEEHDAGAFLLDLRQRALAHLRRRGDEIVLRIDVDVDDDDAAGGKMPAQRGRRCKIGEAEEGRRALFGRDEGGGDACLAAPDLGDRALEAHRREVAMVLRMAADRVAAPGHFADEMRIALSHLADHQERRLDPMRVERVEDGRGLARNRAVVEGEDHLVAQEHDILDGIDPQGTPGKPVAELGQGQDLAGEGHVDALFRREGENGNLAFRTGAGAGRQDQGQKNKAGETHAERPRN